MRTDLHTPIRDRRLQLGLTLEELAQRAGTSISTVHRWECGRMIRASRERLAPFAAALNTTPEYLLGWTDAPEKPSIAELMQAAEGLTADEVRQAVGFIKALKEQRPRPHVEESA